MSSKAVAESAHEIHRYPDATALAVRERIAEKFGVTSDEVIVGAGSVSLIAQFITAAAAPGDEVVYSWRSFEAYPGLVTVAGATSVRVPNRPDHSHDLEAMAAAVTDRTRVVIVCSPNNPTGTVVTADEFERFMAAVPGDLLVLLDEAYIEFVRDEASVDGRTLIGRYPNLVLLRTFSKAYGLAGLRVGYAIGPVAILDAARSTAIPLSVTAASVGRRDRVARRRGRAARTRRRDRRTPRSAARGAHRPGLADPAGAGQLRLAAHRRRHGSRRRPPVRCRARDARVPARGHPGVDRRRVFCRHPPQDSG